MYYWYKFHISTMAYSDLTVVLGGIIHVPILIGILKFFDGVTAKNYRIAQAEAEAKAKAKADAEAKAKEAEAERLKAEAAAKAKAKADAEAKAKEKEAKKAKEDSQEES